MIEKVKRAIKIVMLSTVGIGIGSDRYNKCMECKLSNELTRSIMIAYKCKEKVDNYGRE